MREYVVSNSRLFIAVVLFGLAIGSVLVVGFRVFTVGANHTGNGALHACAANLTGNLRLVSQPNDCRIYEQAVNLGAADALGLVSGYEITIAEDTIPNGSSKAVISTCDNEKHILGGGAQFTNSTSDQALVISAPFSTVGWQADYRNDSGTAGTLTVFAICAHTDFATS